MEIRFKVGDWIIATKPAMRPSMGLSLMGSGVVADCAYMHRPIKIKTITESHIIYEAGYSGGVILPFHELQERGFIIAAPELIEATTSK